MLALWKLPWLSLWMLHVGRKLLRVADCGGVKRGAQGLHWAGLRLRRLLHIGIVLGWCGGMDRGNGAAGSAGAEDDLTRCSLAKIANHHDVVAGAIEKLGEDVAGGGGTIFAVDACVGGESVDVSAGERGDFGEDIREAGVGCIDAEAVAVPDDVGGLRFFVCGPVGQLRNGDDLERRRGVNGRLSRFGSWVQMTASLMECRRGMRFERRAGRVLS